MRREEGALGIAPGGDPQVGGLSGLLVWPLVKQGFFLFPFIWVNNNVLNNLCKNDIWDHFFKIDSWRSD